MKILSHGYKYAFWGNKNFRDIKVSCCTYLRHIE